MLSTPLVMLILAVRWRGEACLMSAIESILAHVALPDYHCRYAL